MMYVCADEAGGYQQEEEPEHAEQKRHQRRAVQQAPAVRAAGVRSTSHRVMGDDEPGHEQCDPDDDQQDPAAAKPKGVGDLRHAGVRRPPLPWVPGNEGEPAFDMPGSSSRDCWFCAHHPGQQPKVPVDDCGGVTDPGRLWVGAHLFERLRASSTRRWATWCVAVGSGAVRDRGARRSGCSSEAHAIVSVDPSRWTPGGLKRGHRDQRHAVGGARVQPCTRSRPSIRSG